MRYTRRPSSLHYREEKGLFLRFVEKRYKKSTKYLTWWKKRIQYRYKINKGFDHLLFHTSYMQKSSLLKKIISLGGTAQIEQDGDLKGRLGNYSIQMFHNGGYGIDFFTLTKDGTEYDHGADYNPSGAIFLRRLKDLEAYAVA